MEVIQAKFIIKIVNSHIWGYLIIVTDYHKKHHQSLKIINLSKPALADDMNFISTNYNMYHNRQSTWYMQPIGVPVGLFYLNNKMLIFIYAKDNPDI